MRRIEKPLVSESITKGSVGDASASKNTFLYLSCFQNVFDPRNESCAFYWQSLHLDGKGKTDTNDANLTLTKASREKGYKGL